MLESSTHAQDPRIAQRRQRVDRFTSPVQAFIATETAGGVVLLAAAIFALGYKEGAVSWRAPLVALAITAVGTVVGLARRGAEHIPDYSD